MWFFGYINNIECSWLVICNVWELEYIISFDKKYYFYYYLFFLFEWDIFFLKVISLFLI